MARKQTKTQRSHDLDLLIDAGDEPHETCEFHWLLRLGLLDFDQITDEQLKLLEEHVLLTKPQCPYCTGNGLVKPKPL
jgi:hypothetical protein